VAADLWICYEKQVKSALRLLVLLPIFLPACQTTGSGVPPNSRVILETPAVRVLADARERGREWTIRGIEADVLAGGGMRRLRVTVFDDKDGNGRASGGTERLGNWLVESPAGSQHMAISGHLTWIAAPSRDALQRLRIETHVLFSDGSDVRANEPVFDY